VSYRRGDSGHAGRLYDALSSHFGADNVFMDVDTIDPGADFAEVINRAVTSCNVVIALIGRGWLTANDTEGRRRLEDPDDFVRLELESGLAHDIVVIPTCVQGAAVPAANELPPSLAPLAGRQAVELRDIGWHDDVTRLIRRLERLADSGKEEARAPATPPPTPRSWRSRRLLVPALAAALGIAAVVIVLATRGSGDGGSDPAAVSHLRSLVTPITRPTCEQISWGEESARASLGCGGANLAVEYHLFPDKETMAGWYLQRRELEGIEPGAGACTASTFRGEDGYTIGGAVVGRYFCYVDSDGESQLVWTDGRVGVGSEANIYKGKGRAAAASILRQWRCCLRLEP
jgi:TIR domain-containing protein